MRKATDVESYVFSRKWKTQDLVEVSCCFQMSGIDGVVAMHDKGWEVFRHVTVRLFLSLWQLRQVQIINQTKQSRV